jgi:hypothetical protein
MAERKLDQSALVTHRQEVASRDRRRLGQRVELHRVRIGFRQHVKAAAAEAERRKQRFG